MAIGYVLTGALLCLTIIGIPFGVQSIKMAGLALQPFGKKVVRAKDMANFYAGATATAYHTEPFEAASVRRVRVGDIAHHGGGGDRRSARYLRPIG